MNGESQSGNSSWLRTIAIGRNPLFTLIRIIILVVSTVILFGYVFVAVRITGISMAPNYVNGRLNLVNKLAYRKAEPKRGDVVAIRLVGERVVLLKRIIGLPGERVFMNQTRVYVNGEHLKEHYVKNAIHRSWTGKYWILEKDQYLVIGDNRQMPMSAHYYEVSNKKNIIGKAVF